MGWNDEKDDQGKKSVELDLFSKNSVDGKSNPFFLAYVGQFYFYAHL